VGLVPCVVENRPAAQSTHAFDGGTVDRCPGLHRRHAVPSGDE
jgi:hypothetical protein